jgi:cobalt-zinc-cadmium efflux system protein
VSHPRTHVAVVPHGPGGVPDAADRFLRAGLLIASAILVVEVAGGLWSGSLALLSDAGHMLTDVLALGLAWWASRLGRRAPTLQRTYGFHRAGILVALLNAGLLIAVAAVIAAEAVVRLRHPVPVRPEVMWVVAAVALGGNLVLGLGLGRGARSREAGLNARSAWLHVIGDAAASAGVLAGGAVILFTGWLWVDPALSAAIAGLIAVGAWGIVRETVGILMEGTPPGVDPDEVAAVMEQDEDILAVHHIHVWSLASGRHAMSGHVVVRDGPLSATGALVRRQQQVLARRFGIEHSTLQVESATDWPCDEECSESPGAVPAGRTNR